MVYDDGYDDDGSSQMERELQDWQDEIRLENLIQHISTMENEGGINFDHPMGCEQEQFEAAWIVVDPQANLCF